MAPGFRLVEVGILSGWSILLSDICRNDDLAHLYIEMWKILGAYS